jgi:hypothetical protein
MVSSLFFNGVHSFVPNPVYAQTTLSVTITSACEFEDGDDPNLFGNCLEFNDGGTISFDNVRFSASSNAPVKQFVCKLERDGVTIPLDTDNTCTSSQITATATYLDLDGGNYQFTVTAVRDVDGPLGTPVDEESVTSAVIRFTVLGAGEGSAAGLEAGLARDSLKIAGNATLYSSFFDMISEGETKFLNVKNIKPHTIIKPNSIACFSGDDGGYNPGATSDDTDIFIQERDCDNIIVFEKNETDRKDSIESQDPVISSKLLTALNGGLERPISGCVIGILDEGWVDLEGVKCENLFIAYK